jgi:hypothetical protein
MNTWYSHIDSRLRINGTSHVHLRINETSHVHLRINETSHVHLRINETSHVQWAFTNHIAACSAATLVLKYSKPSSSMLDIQPD